MFFKQYCDSNSNIKSRMRYVSPQMLLGQISYCLKLDEYKSKFWCQPFKTRSGCEKILTSKCNALTLRFTEATEHTIYYRYAVAGKAKGQTPVLYSTLADCPFVPHGLTVGT